MVTAKVGDGGKTPPKRGPGPNHGPAGVGNNYKPIKYQPNFHPKITAIYSGARSNKGALGGLKRGFIASHDPGRPYGVAFLFNPTSLETDWAIDQGTILPTDLTQSDHVNGDQSTNYLGGLGSITFSLLFDRTYETWDAAYVNRPEGRFGVYVDIRQFYLMLGVNTGATSALSSFEIPTGPMQPTLVKTYFGGLNSLAFLARIMSFNVTYTHWTQSMVPNRAVVALSMLMMPPGADTVVAPDAPVSATTASSLVGTDPLVTFRRHG